MNQEALRVSYDQAVEEGYNGDMSEFYTLLQTDTEAADLAYLMAKEEGYKLDQLNFEVLLGLKKKEENFPNLFPSEYQSSNLPSGLKLNTDPEYVDNLFKQKAKTIPRIQRVDPTVPEMGITEVQENLIKPPEERIGRVNQFKVTQTLLEKTSLDNKIKSIVKSAPSDTQKGIEFNPNKPYVINQNLMIGEIITEMPELDNITGEDELNTFLENNPDVIEKFEEKVKEKLKAYVDNTSDDSIYKYKSFDPTQSSEAQSMMGARTNKLSKKVDADPDKLAIVESLYSGLSGFDLNELTNYFDEEVTTEAGLDKRNRIIQSVQDGNLDLIDKYSNQDFEDEDDADKGALALDVQKSQALGLYIQDKIKTLDDREALLQLNPKKNKDALKKLKQNRKELILNFGEYNRQNLPFLNNHLYKKKVRLAEEYTSGNMGLYNPGDIIHGGYEGGREILEGGYGATVDLGSTVLDFVGLDSMSEDLRIHRNLNNLLWTDPTSFGYAEGKVVIHDGKKYIVTPEGQIIDEEREVDVAFFGEQAGIDLNAIKNKAQLSDTTESTVSMYGTYQMGANVTGNLAVQLVGMKGTGALLKGGGKLTSAIGMGKLTKEATMRTNAMLSTGAVVYSSTYNQVLEEARAQGLPDNLAHKYANEVATTTGLVGAITAVTISPNIGGQQLFSRTSPKEIAEYLIKNKTTNNIPGKVLDFLKGGAVEGTFEAVQENLELLSEQYAKNKINKNVGKELFKPVFTKTSVMNNSIAAFASAGLLGGAGSINTSRVTFFNRLGSNQELFQKYMKMYVEQGLIDQIGADKIVNEVKNYHQYKNKLPENLRNSSLSIKLTNLLAEKTRLQDLLKTQDEVFSEDTNTRIAAIDKEIKRISNEAGKKKVTPSADIKDEREISNQEAIDAITKENQGREERGENLIGFSEQDIANKKQEILKQEQDASTKPSAVAQTSQDESTTVGEVAEGVPSEVQRPSGTSDSDTDSDVDTTTQEEVIPEDEVVAEVEAITEEQAEQELEGLLNQTKNKNKNVVNVGTEGRNKSISRKASSQTREEGFNTKTPQGKRRFNKIKSEITNAYNKKLRTLKRAANLLGKVIPDTKIIFAETRSAYQNLRGKSNSVGAFRFNKLDGSTAIIIDVTNLDGDKGIETLVHELFHAVLYKRFGRDKAKVRRITDKMVKELQKTLQNSNDKELQDIGKSLFKFTQLYKKPMQTEEFLSEALGLISEKFDIIRRNSKALNSVTNFVESIASLLGLGKAKKELSKDPDRVLRALVMVAKKIQNNEVLQDTDFDILNEIEIEVDQEGTDAPIVTGEVTAISETDTTADEEVTITVLEDIEVEVDEVTTEDRVVDKVVDKKKRPSTTEATSATLLRKISTAIKQAIRQSKKQQKKIKIEVALSIREAVKQGTLSAKQALVLAKRALTLNVDSPLAVERFILYTKKAFADADSIFKLKTANTFRKQLKKIGNTKTIDAAIAAAAKNFALMDPIYVEDLDLYNQLAKELVDGSKSSRVLKGELKQKRIADLAKINSFADNQLEKEKVEIEATMRDEFEAMTGIDAKDMTYAQMKSYLDDKTPAPSEQDESIIRQAVSTMFKKYSDTIKQMLSSGVDAATGNPLNLSANEKSIVKKFMDMDLSVMGIKEVIRSVDALNNFIVNRNTGGMETVVKNNIGASNVSQMVKDNKIVKPRGKFKELYESVVIPYLKQIATMPMTLKTVLGSLDNYIDFQIKSGLRDFISGQAKAIVNTNNMVKDYVKKFGDLKPNNEAFDSTRNNIERGLYAFLVRTTSGDVDSSKKEFKRRLRLVEQSIAKYRRGNKEQKETAEILQNIYDKIKDADSSSEIENSFDQVNKDAVLSWQNEWAKVYPTLAQTSYNIYNQILGNDVNYTPDKFSVFEADVEVDLDNESAFGSFSGTLFNKKAGVLFESTKPQQLPKDRVVNFNFDSNMSNSMEAAQMDIQTAPAYNQIKGFVQSPELKKLIPDESARKLVVDKMVSFINSAKKQKYLPKEEAGAVSKALDLIANLGVGRALIQVFQPVKQVLPVALNTIINSKGNLDITSFTNIPIQKWIDSVGTSIAIRGGLSSADLAKLENFTNSDEFIELTKNPIRLIKKLNTLGLEMFLVKPDKAIARVSFITYYKQKLKEKGVDVNAIDWETHKADKEALAYAEAQVDLQQNISSSDMFGEFFKSDNFYKKNIRRIFLPFASFAMNLKTRVYTDLPVLFSKTASKSEKQRAALSIASAGVEVAAFQAIGGLITAMMSKIGYDDDEEKRKKRIDNIIKGRKGNIVTEFLNPVAHSLVDGYILKGINKTMSAITGDDEKIFFDSDTKNLDVGDVTGQYGIAFERGLEVIDLTKLAFGDGVFTDRFGNKRKISKESQERLKTLVLPSLLYNLGLLPAEAGTFTRYQLRETKTKNTKKAN